MSRGQVIPLVAIALTALLGFGGMAVDVGFLEYRQQSQQTATDAAASGGAQALLHAGCPNQTAAQSAAYANATNNGFTNGSGNVTVTPYNPPSSGPFAANPCAVSVTIKTGHVATFFSKLFGYQYGMDESTHATAIVSSTGAGCIYLLSMTTQSDLTNTHITADKCGILINDSANMSNSTIDAASIGYAGTTPNESGANFTEAAPAPMLPVADPCPEIPGCAYLTNNPPSTSGCPPGGTYNNTTLNPGCFGKLTLTGTDTLNPGIYVINGQFHLNGATVSGSGVTIYMTSSVSDTNFSSAHLTLTAPTSGNTSGVVLYRVPAQSADLDLSTCFCNLGGLVYFPTTQVNYSNTGDVYTVLVFGNANFSTSSGEDFATPPPQQSLVKTAVVAE